MSCQDALLNQVIGLDDEKITLKTTTIKALPRLELTGAEIVKIREKLRVSRPVFAHALRVNPRKLESWEQNRSRVSDEAAMRQRP